MSRVLSTMLCVSVMFACGVEEFGDPQYDRPKNQPSVASGGDEGNYGGASAEESTPVSDAGTSAGGTSAFNPATDASSTAAGDTHVILL